MGNNSCKNMHIYGLTGGIASGKSEVSARLSELCFTIIDADRIGHELIAPGGEAVDKVIAAFGQKIVIDGKISRDLLGRIVFADASELTRLNEIMHPVIRHRIESRCRELASEGADKVIIDAAIIGDSGKIEIKMDGLILVLASSEERLQRLMTARNLSREQAKQRIDAQVSPEAKLHLANWIVENNGTEFELRTQVDALARELTRHG